LPLASRTRYTRSGDLHIAYQEAGDAPVDLVYVPTWIGQVETLVSEPSVHAFIERLCAFARVITFDRRGSGLSDPTPGAATLEEQMDDVLAVMDAVGSSRAAMMGSLEGGPMAMTFAATHPERVSELILYASFATPRRHDDYDWPPADDERDARIEASLAQWGEGAIPAALAPSRAGDPEFMEWAGKMERYSASPGQVRSIFKAVGETDVRHVLPTINVPTLVMHRRGDTFIDIRHSRYLAEHIPGARMVELEGSESLFSIGDSESILGEIEEFLTGTRHEREPDRVLATVLFTDIVDSTRRAAAMGDAGWRELLERHDQLARLEIRRNRGRAVKSTGDGVLATFDGPARAIRAADAIRRRTGDLGLEVRAGLHTGECEVIGDDVGGLAVHIGARVMSQAQGGEVLVSSTVKDLVAGSGIAFADRGEHELKGIPDRWSLFSVASLG
jgi:class 3 adenylate cyclase